jgi:hypothetical protein
MLLKLPSGFAHAAVLWILSAAFSACSVTKTEQASFSSTAAPVAPKPSEPSPFDGLGPPAMSLPITGAARPEPVSAARPMPSAEMPKPVAAMAAPPTAAVKAKPQSRKPIPAQAAATPAPASEEKFEDIKAELGAVPTIKVPGQPGDLRVWIGDAKHSANFPSEFKSASEIIPTSIKPNTILVRPNANAFEVDPPFKCQNFDPSGTTVSFALKPKFERNETYLVGASIEIFADDNCQGRSNPKSANDIHVKVAVEIMPDDTWKLIRENIGKVLAGSLSIISGLILFSLRKFLKKMFGFEDKAE